MRRISSPTLSIGALALSILLLDYLTKYLAIAHFSQEPREIFGKFLQFTLVKNSGAAFGIGTGFTIAFSLFAVAVVAVVIRYATQIKVRSWVITTGLLLGGALGNLADRIFREPGFLQGHVIDWIKIPDWPVFNIADISIICAAISGFILTVRNIPPITRIR